MKFEGAVNIVGSLVTIGTLVVTLVLGHWDWQVAFFVLLAFTCLSLLAAYYDHGHRVRIKMFKGVSKAERMCQGDIYAAKRIREAKMNVWDFAWQDDKEPDQKINLRETVRSSGSKALDAAIREVIISGSVDYHEILTTKAYMNLLKKHLGYCHEITDGTLLKYRARIYDNTLQNYKKFPKIQFVVIDEEEVIFLSSGYEHCFAMKSKEAACVFIKYARMAWSQADDWTSGVKDIVLDGKIVPAFETYLKQVLEDLGGTSALDAPKH